MKTRESIIKSVACALCAVLLVSAFSGCTAKNTADDSSYKKASSSAVKNGETSVAEESSAYTSSVPSDENSASTVGYYDRHREVSNTVVSDEKTDRGYTAESKKGVSSKEKRESVPSVSDYSEPESEPHSSVDTGAVVESYFAMYLSACEKNDKYLRREVTVAEQYLCPESGLHQTRYLKSKYAEDGTYSQEFHNILRTFDKQILVYVKDGVAYVDTGDSQFIADEEDVDIDLPPIFEVSAELFGSASIVKLIDGCRLTFVCDDGEALKPLEDLYKTAVNSDETRKLSVGQFVFTVELDAKNRLRSTTVAFVVTAHDTEHPDLDDGQLYCEQCFEYALGTDASSPEIFDFVTEL